MLAPTELTDAEQQLQADIEHFLDERLPVGSYEVSLGMLGRSDPAFSKDLGSAGWLGITLPQRFGGRGGSAVDRLIVAEQLLARGAPVSYHWVAERQMGPMIERFGSEEQRTRYLPGIVAGTSSFSIGMSEPDAGSDLASVRTRAREVSGGWRINGSKIWTSGADTATHILGLFRTSDDRHGGLTKFIVDADTPGLTVSPITFIDGTRDFCEVVFDDVLVPDANRLGEVGAGWTQNTSELVLERSGVDRWMSALPVVANWAAELDDEDHEATSDLGAIIARLWGLRGLSLAVARLVDAGQSPVAEAAMIKELATTVERACVDAVDRHQDFAATPVGGTASESLLARAVLVAPSWSIRGGTNEILRSIIAKELVK